MTTVEHLLEVLSEECAEVIQRVSKANRFGLHEIQNGQHMTNARRIQYELQDLVASVELLQEYEVLGQLDRDAIIGKKDRVRGWLEYARTQGTVVEPKTT